MKVWEIREAIETYLAESKHAVAEGLRQDRQGVNELVIEVQRGRCIDEVCDEAIVLARACEEGKE